ncbi:endonuclease/exonuclease/phosphatase family protein [Shinella granuli]|jgi:endonuclease/exonuclease/phosphatase family metal-dependent hydrolase|uniref:Endonuclease/exonuclease/phosphatase family metal-dependent hydrolase n=1 Tax=Shinella granuli TaxID=323621 RepID=A0A4R2CV28_SHIGR|nr:endonuclease/exonuclease/phosphatase family protein [Shinella granuli]TCN43484.1 endonuclease/exonuclease/phosphatase family metal-dependent hydrolase [Shinella granuli]
MARRLRIATYNVHSCFGTDRKLDPARIAAVIAECEADIIALQEVDVARARSGGIDQAETIASHLRMVSHFHPALHLEEERYGDALLTALPTRLVKAGGLPSRGEPRGALWVEVPVDMVKLQVFVTHLGLLGAERVRQTEALIGPGWLGAEMPENSRILFAGDLNAISRSASYRLLVRRFGDAQVMAGGRPQPTFPSRLPLLRIDHIFVGEGIRVERAFVHDSPLARRASDHLPLCADFEIM